MAKSALVISGGGCKGAFAVGAIKYLLGDRNLKFDIVSGTSTGSLIAPLVVAKRLDILEELYISVTTPNIISTQPLPDALAGQSSLFDTKPLQVLMETHYTDQVFQALQNSTTQMFITTVNLNSGRLTYFSTGPAAVPSADVVPILDRSHLIRAVLASANQPAFMPPIRVNQNSGDLYVDGGVREVLPLRIVIENLAEEIYAIALSPPGTERIEPAKTRNILEILMRTLGLILGEASQSNLDRIQLLVAMLSHIEEVKMNLRAEGMQEATIAQMFDTVSLNPLAGLRKIVLQPIIRPQRDLLEQFHVANDLIFEPVPMAQMMTLGREIAHEILSSRIASTIVA